MSETAFCLDARLARDCHRLGQVDDILLLRMDNGQLPWFVLVPTVTHTEFYQLDAALQQRLLHLSNVLGRYLKDAHRVDKLNIATIGNVVSQLHVHVVGRFHDDYAWPGVVWGVAQDTRCEADSVAASREDMARLFGAAFIPAP